MPDTMAVVILSAVLSVCTVAIGVTAKIFLVRIITAIHELQKAVNDLKLDIAVRYVTRVDFDRMMEALGDKADEYETRFCGISDRLIVVEQRMHYLGVNTARSE